MLLWHRPALEAIQQQQQQFPSSHCNTGASDFFQQRNGWAAAHHAQVCQKIGAAEARRRYHFYYSIRLEFFSPQKVYWDMHGLSLLIDQILVLTSQALHLDAVQSLLWLLQLHQLWELFPLVEEQTDNIERSCHSLLQLHPISLSLLLLCCISSRGCIQPSLL